MAREFATSDKLLVVGIGAAGAGKTSSTRLAVDAIEASGNRVIGMAPTAAAAAVMRSEMRINADTVDKFLTDWQSGKKPLDVRPGDVLLVDEAGMIATPKMEKILTLAQERGALVRALGDYRQLSAVGSGGALRLVDREIGAVHLASSLGLRTLKKQRPHSRCVNRPWSGQINRSSSTKKTVELWPVIPMP